MAAPVTAGQGGDDGQMAPNVWLCHYANNDSADPSDYSWALPEEAWLTGDYVINNPKATAGGPADEDVLPGDHCVGHGGIPIIVNADALDDHGAQLQNRVEQYMPAPELVASPSA